MMTNLVRCQSKLIDVWTYIHKYLWCVPIGQKLIVNYWISLLILVVTIDIQSIIQSRYDRRDPLDQMTTWRMQTWPCQTRWLRTVRFLDARALHGNHEQIFNKHADILPNYPTFTKTIVLSKRCILTLKTTNVCYGYDNRMSDTESLLRQSCSYEYD